MKPIKVICVPHAGGFASSYMCFKKYADEDLDFIPIELTGRGVRADEPLYHNFNEAVEDVYKIVKQEIDTTYVLFGHSMGCWIVYELYYKLKERKDNLPIHLFLSGNVPPYKRDNRTAIYNLPDEKFIQEICKYGGTQHDIFEVNELRNLVMPILRSDYRMIEMFEPEAKGSLIERDITVLGGTQDRMINGKLADWSKYTERECDICYFDGGHFYLFNSQQEIINTIYRKIEVFNNMV